MCVEQIIAFHDQNSSSNLERIIDRYHDVKSNFYLCVTNFGVLKKTDDDFFANNNSLFSLIPVFWLKIL